MPRAVSYTHLRSYASSSQSSVDNQAFSVPSSAFYQRGGRQSNTLLEPGLGGGWWLVSDHSVWGVRRGVGRVRGWRRWAIELGVAGWVGGLRCRGIQCGVGRRGAARHGSVRLGNVAWNRLAPRPARALQGQRSYLRKHLWCLRRACRTLVATRCLGRACLGNDAPHDRSCSCHSQSAHRDAVAVPHERRSNRRGKRHQTAPRTVAHGQCKLGGSNEAS